MNNSGIFFDSANLEEFKRWFDTGILGGVTTNPVILQKDGVLDVPGHIEKMIEICGPDFPISIEIPDSEMSREVMIDLALGYHSKFPDNAVIKVPMDPRDLQKAFEVIYTLGQKGVRVNATLGIGAGQLIGAAEALRGSWVGDNYISLFCGRCDEAKGPGAAVEALKTTLKYLETHDLFSSKVIIGSIRSPGQIEQAFALGAHIVTIPPKLIEKWMFTERGVETADQFNKAYREVKDKMKLI